MRYLTLEEILVIHSEIIDIVGGSHGVRELGMLGSVVTKPSMAFGGKDLYPTVFIKAAVYLESIANYHVFIDGNKRTAFAIAVRFLFINGYDISDVSDKEIVNFIVNNVVVKKISLADIAAWLKNVSVKIKSKKK